VRQVSCELSYIRILLLSVNGPTSDHNCACAFTDVVDGEHMKARQNHARGANHWEIADLPASDGSQHRECLVHLHLSCCQQQQQQLLSWTTILHGRAESDCLPILLSLSVFLVFFQFFVVGSRFLSLNHALISLTHPIFWVALPPFIPSTHHSHRLSSPHSFIPGLKLSFSANLSYRSLPFLLQDWLHGFPGLFTDASEHALFSFWFICFPHFSFLFSAVD